MSVIYKKEFHMAKFTNSLGDALTNFWTDYVGWGRATRSEFWWVYLFYDILAVYIITFISILLYGTDLLGNIFLLATAIPGFCLTARRLHDTGRSAWNMLWALLPIIGWIILIVYECQPGQKSANKWGKPRI